MYETEPFLLTRKFWGMDWDGEKIPVYETGSASFTALKVPLSSSYPLP